MNNVYQEISFSWEEQSIIRLTDKEKIKILEMIKTFFFVLLIGIVIYVAYQGMSKGVR